MKSFINATCAGFIFLLLMFLFRFAFPRLLPRSSFADALCVIPVTVLVYLVSVQLESMRKRRARSTEKVVITKKELLTYAVGFVAVMLPSVLILMGVDTFSSWIMMISGLLIFLVFGNDEKHDEY